MKIGKITSVNFNQFKVKVSSDIKGNSINLAGDIYYFGNIGSYLKTSNSLGEKLICEVISIFNSDIDSSFNKYDIEGNRELILKPIGTISTTNTFSLGVGIFPSIYSEVDIVTFADMEIILKNNNPRSIQENIHSSFHLGTSKNLINYPIDININDFFNIHSAILGNSGSGKSNTIAHILQEIHRKIEHSAIGSRILIFDVNGEYKNAFREHKEKSDLIHIKYYKPNIHVTDNDGFEPFYMPHFLMTIDEWSSFLMATDATQRPFWDKVLQEAQKFYQIAVLGNSERKKFAHYLKYKLSSLLNILISQGDSDTAIITTARNIIYGITSLILLDQSLKEACQQEGILQDLQTLQDSCTLKFGSNDDKLKTALDKISDQINYYLVNEVLDIRISQETYFDYQFLKKAAEIILLEEDAKGNRRIREFTSTMMARLDYFLDNSSCSFMRERPNENIINAESYLNWLWGISKETKKINMLIIDTSELSRDALETLTSVISRLNFTDRKQLINDERRKKPIHLILDEAHRYIKKDTKYLLKENIFEQIAREGRKYAIFLMISSQRPSELSETVLSQCSNFIIHRIQNEIDMRYIYSILPFFSEDFVNKIKQSIPGEALVFGNCVAMPLHLRIKKAYPEPNSENCHIQNEWFLPNTSS